MIPYHSFYSWQLGPLTIQAWGVFVALGFLIATYFAVKEAKRKDIDPNHIYNLVTYLLISGIIGSRLLHVITNLSNFADFWSIFRIWEGGLDFFGGFLLSMTVLYFYIRKHKLPILKTLDLLAPPIAIGHAFGRLGCIFGDGGHVGKLTTMPWGALILDKTSQYYNEVRHLTSLYEFLGLTAIFIILYKLRKKHFPAGYLFSIYLVSYGLLRFILDFTRIDSTYLGLTIAQYISIAIFILGLTFLIKKRRGKL